MQIDFGFTCERAKVTTISQFLTLWDQWLAKEDRENYRASVIAAVVANTSARKRRKAIQPLDIIPSLKEKLKEQQINSPEDQVAILKQLYGETLFDVDVISED